jgi:hypothetical protein
VAQRSVLAPCPGTHAIISHGFSAGHPPFRACVCYLWRRSRERAQRSLGTPGSGTSRVVAEKGTHHSLSPWRISTILYLVAMSTVSRSGCYEMGEGVRAEPLRGSLKNAWSQAQCDARAFCQTEDVSAWH